MNLVKIISGGQTGADQGALIGADLAGLATGGWMPKGWKTEKGSNPRFGRHYGLQCTDKPDYPTRTFRNVEDSDGTFWFGKLDSSGYVCTWRACRQFGRPLREASLLLSHLDQAKSLADFIETEEIQILNIAGNRESRNPGIAQHVCEVVQLAVKLLRGERIENDD